MHVLHLHEHFMTRKGAGGSSTYELARHMLDQGHEVTFVVGHRRASGLTDERHQHVDGLDIINLGGWYANHLGAKARMWQFLRYMARACFVRRSELKSPPDVILASSTPLTTCVPGWVLSRRFKVPFVFEVQDVWPRAAIELGYLKSPLLIRVARWLERWAYRRATAIVALSPGMADEVLKAGADPRKVVTIPNASDLELFNPRFRDRALLDRWDVGEKFVAVHGGSMGEANGLDYLVRAAKVLADRGIDDVHLMLCGDGGTRPRLERMVREWQLENVTFTGSIPREELGAIVSSVDVSIVSFAHLPILTTNSPNKMFDGMAAALPIIVNSDGWTRKVVERSGCGAYAPADDPAALADALIAMRDDPEGCRRMGAEARRVAETRFDRDLLNRRYQLVLEAGARGEHPPEDGWEPIPPPRQDDEPAASGASSGGTGDT